MAFPHELLPKLADLDWHAAAPSALPDAARQLLCVLPAGEDWFDAFAREAVQHSLQRRGSKAQELAKKPVAVELPGGCLSSWVRLDPQADPYTRHTRLRQALQPLLEERPRSLHIAVYGPDAFRVLAARAAVYTAWLNGCPLPSRKREDKPWALERIHIHGLARLDLARERAVAEGNHLARRLTWLPPNELTPASYRAHVRTLAQALGWAVEEYDLKRLRKLGAGAFLAVARGSQHEDAAIVRVHYDGGGRGKRKGHYALVGKGICFDTGGHNLKPARYMHNMHDDMNGSAVALGVLLAATRLKFPLRLSAWLAIAQNHLSPSAYTQNEVVRALNGTSIEVVHTDAEGRMVLADTLTLAAREEPQLILDFATLTGSMTVALGERMSGVLANRSELATLAVAAGEAVGERVVAFPAPEDYDEALESQVADVKQCILEAEADHILAARFLARFVGERPWLHVDLSASRCKGGLGAVASELTGFGVALGVELLERLRTGAAVMR
ncbi:MAG: leucyl aminopeptidase family protein [Thiobacillaceae bacterium]|nr:leucyl aminopeptidase family protein [Thiobacillaceae bacterium]MCX7672168.1 leucyl aminopeptidase family protein [Thiobacillaceae bacterium]MDW8323885.1 leucyl aminopeptidase family protein [Burkholderiales bacterium]